MSLFDRFRMQDKDMALESSTKPQKVEETINRDELIQLFSQDQELKNIICSIVASNLRHEDDSAHTHETECEKIEAPAKIISTEPKDFAWTSDSLRVELEKELLLLKHVKEDSEISNEWLHGNISNEGQELVGLISIASQWNEILKLWDLLAARCKSDSRQASEEELLILHGALSVHNRVWIDRKATLKIAKRNEQFDYEIHDRLSLRGDVVEKLCLPGIVNAAQKLQKKCLVETV